MTNKPYYTVTWFYPQGVDLTSKEAFATREDAEAYIGREIVGDDGTLDIRTFRINTVEQKTMTNTRSVEITVPADPDADDCLAAAAERYFAEHSNLRGYDLAPRWTDDSDRESVTLTVPLWHYESISGT